jgi:dipeptidyl aminopeptidase/acylaminoacyl peptidase
MNRTRTDPLFCVALFVVAVVVYPVAATEPAALPRESWITFLSRRSGSNLLYRMRPDGSECKPVFGGPVKDAPGLGEGLSLVREPHWTWQSPDRKYFASCAYERIRPRDGRHQYYFSLHLGRADGSGPTRVIVPVCEEAVAWSPDGKRVAFTVLTSHDPEDRNAARVSRVFTAAIDGTDEQLILERPGLWLPADWSPDGKKLLLNWSEFINLALSRQSIVELDMERVAQAIKNIGRRSRWQREMHSAIREVLGKAAPVEVNDARYSPDGKSIAVTATRKPDKPGDWQPLDFELGVIDRATATYKKVAWYKEGLRGPICWSPDGSEILFSRPLKEGDTREGGQEKPGALRQEWGLGLWSIKPDGTRERFLTTGWSPDWR